MPIRKRGKTWQLDVTVDGKRHREQFQTKRAAVEAEAKLVTAPNPNRGRTRHSASSSAHYSASPEPPASGGRAER